MKDSAGLHVLEPQARPGDPVDFTKLKSPPAGTIAGHTPSADADLKTITFQLLRAVGNCSVDLIYAKDRQGRFLFANPPVLAVYGKTAEEMIGRTDVEIHHHKAQAVALMANDLRIMTTGQTEIVEEIFDVDGIGTRIFRSAKAPLRLEDDEIAGIVGVSSDITPLKTAEAALRQMAADLEGRVLKEVAAREAAQAQAAQAARLQALGQLAGGIAHDFNNVLQAISAGLTLIARHSNNKDEISRIARMMNKAVDRGSSITNRLLTFSRSGDLRAELLDVSPLLDSLHEILVPTLGASIDVRIDRGIGTEALFVDRGQLETVLVNLATNARDAMPKGGKLTISAQTKAILPNAPRDLGILAPGRYIKLSVSDSGHGMDHATLARAREPFFTTKQSGTGLGLAMAQGFIDQSGGAMEIESIEGQGTTVILWLPVADAAASALTEFKLDGVESAGPAQILVVDDEEIIRELLSTHLENAGHRVVTAGNGTEALALLDSGIEIEALVTDFSMPGMDGVTVIKAARRHYPGLPALLLTGYAGDEATLAASDVPAASFVLLRKPVSGDQLLSRLHALLTGHATRRG
jgi:PAS domain S-box-containing protein